MKSYLELVKNYEKVHRKQNRITILCIVIAVSLVTAIFGMADMEARAQRIREINEHGKWHFAIKRPTAHKIDELTEKFGKKFETSGYVLGFNSTANWYYDNQPFRLTSGDEGMITNCGLETVEGRFPKDKSEIMIDSLTAKRMQISVGDSLEFDMTNGEKKTFTVTGLYSNTAIMLEAGFSGVVINLDLVPEVFDTTEYRSVYYVYLKDMVTARSTIDGIKEELGFTDEDISENITLLAMSGQSKDAYMIQMYGVAFVLFILVLIAGVLMISGTFNTNVEERTQFFGMLRCLGATKRQIQKYVLYESIRFLRIAVPIGVIIGVLTYWGACAYLKFANYEFFSEMPMFGFSAVSIIGGVAVGFCTVILAALAPCRKASRVSPLTAVTANQYSNGVKIKHRASTRVFHVEDTLGIHHATTNKKSLFLMIGSFGISIVLFLSFSVIVSFMSHALTPLEAWSPDVEYSSPELTNSIKVEELTQIEKLSGVKKVFARKYEAGQLTTENGTQIASFISYDENQFGWAKKYLIDGDIDAIADGEPKIMLAYNMLIPYKAGDKVKLTVNGIEKDVEVGAVVSKTPFKVNTDEAVVIANEELFNSFAATDGYAVVDIQLTRDGSDDTVEQIYELAGKTGSFSDSRLSNAQIKAVNGSFSTFIYGFLAIIALITVFNIINSMNMSINARLMQYSVMHAVGMSASQIKRMVFAEAITYAVLGCIFGGCVGLLLNYKLFGMIITFRWGTQWSVPWIALIVIALLVIGSTILSVIGPMRKCKHFALAHII